MPPRVGVSPDSTILVFTLSDVRSEVEAAVRSARKIVESGDDLSRADTGGQLVCPLFIGRYALLFIKSSFVEVGYLYSIHLILPHYIRKGLVWKSFLSSF